MADARVTVADRVRALLGPDALVGVDAGGAPRVAPSGDDAVALLLRTAAQAAWRVRVEGGAAWLDPDGPADVVLTTRALKNITYLNPADLVATVEAGVAWADLRRALADHGAWVPLDPPGTDRTVGSVIATGTVGALRAGFGGPRDHVLGLTLVTGDGRVVRPGGRVVKNVAGFDLTKLAVGSFGAFGVITSVTLRLRAVPRADSTLVAFGARDALLDAATGILDAGLSPAAMELTGDGERWWLALRLLGTEPSVNAERDAVRRAAGITLGEVSTEEAGPVWQRHAEGANSGAITLRMGCLVTSLEEALDLVSHHLPDGWASATVSSGSIRWSGTATLEQLRLLRHTAAQREMPVTVERAPLDVRRGLGHFGAYREPVGRLITALRDAFDPKRTLSASVGS
jgi:FAD/FMN-containing dehydrogenase